MHDCFWGRIYAPIDDTPGSGEVVGRDAFALAADYFARYP